MFIDKRSTFIVGITAALTLLWMAAAGAQSAPTQEQTAASDEPQLEEVVVTGSLIKRPNAETAEAITILKTDALKDEGIENVEQAISTLTSAAPTVNIASNVGSFTGGGSYANLRHLGNGSTLVLLDGERLANNAFNGAAVDLSGIPFSAIDSVEVLREGASALYGSDAIAGVINFITKKNYQGFEIQGNFDKPQETGGDSGQMNVTFGHGDLKSDGYNFMVTGSYSKQDELTATERAFSATGFNPALGVPNTNFPGSWPGMVQDANNMFWQSGYPACAGNTQLTEYFGDCSYRYSAATDLLPESHEFSGMAVFTKALPANNTLQLQYFYTQSEVNGYSGPMFYDFQMNPASPYFPTASQLTCDSRSPVNCGTSTPDLTDPINAIWSDPNNSRYGGALNNEQRVLLTFSGSNAGWDYATDLNYSKNTNDNRWTGGIPNEALLAPGGILSTLINPFGPQSAAGQALINSSYVNGTYQIGQDSRWSVDGHASHALGDAFNAGTPATVALGVTVNGERFTEATTALNTITAAATGLTDGSTEGSRTVMAAFVEVDLPITKKLDLDVSDRQDRYSDFGTTNNPKLSVRYQPADFLTFRGAASTGFRAPTLLQLYSTPFLTASDSPTMGSGNPFCAPGNYNTEWTPATCQSQGLQLNGGNTKLGPETSENFDLGIIISPIQDMGITLDYYRILLKNVIQPVPASAIYSDPTALSSYIVPNSSGTLTSSVAEANECNPYTAPTCGYILATFQNTGKITTDGFDVSIQYLQRTEVGTFHEDLEGTAISQFLEQQYNSGPTINLVGNEQIAQQLPAYRWEHNLKVDWTSPKGTFGGGVGNRFYSSYIDEYGTDPANTGPQRTVGSYSLWDVYGAYKPTSKMGLIFGIKNLFNTSPPFTNALQNNFAAGYNALVADPLLRNFYINLKYDFL
ncbi:MAG: TonB-dependent receptor [Steroidobacteraceae bacterium]|jgi:iron complex outermembrane receptor protein